MKFKAYLIYMMVIILIAAFPQMIDILASQEIKMQVLYQELQILSDSNQISPIPNFHGFCYGTFRGLGPATGEQAKAEYVQEDLEILKRLNVTDIRTYGSGLNQHIIPQIAYDIGINCATGVWLDYNKVNNEIELQLGLSVANVSSMLIIGNEVLLRHDLTETELLEYISDAKNQSSDLIPITTAETYDIWLDHPNLADACDVLLVHVYPFWEGIQIAYAASYTIEKLNLVQQAYPNKTIYLAEAGWPSSGRVDCSERYQNLFYEDLLPLVAQNQIKAYFFEAFDEAWKTEEGVGPHWGIFNKNRTPKESAMIFEEYFGGEVLFPPTCNIPDDINVAQNESATISWIITDHDNSTGNYTIYRNDDLISQPNETWTDSIPIEISIDTSTITTYTYTIIFTDGIYTVEDAVIVSITTPSNTTTSKTTKTTSANIISPFLLTLGILIVIIQRHKDS